MQKGLRGLVLVATMLVGGCSDGPHCVQVPVSSTTYVWGARCPGGGPPDYTDPASLVPACSPTDDPRVFYWPDGTIDIVGFDAMCDDGGNIACLYGGSHVICVHPQPAEPIDDGRYLLIVDLDGDGRRVIGFVATVSTNGPGSTTMSFSPLRREGSAPCTRFADCTLAAAVSASRIDYHHGTGSALDTVDLGEQSLGVTFTIDVPADASPDGVAMRLRIDLDATSVAPRRVCGIGSVTVYEPARDSLRETRFAMDLGDGSLPALACP